MAPLDMMNQLCKVCGEKATGFHFGVFSCEGCKSFFGRTYNNLAALGDSCKTGGNCIITKKNRTSCKSCRLKKCLVVGMSKSGSRYGRRSNWFKIHCLIQDQTDRLTDPSVLSNSPYDTKDLVGKHFRSEFNDASSLPTNGHSNRGSPSSDPGNTTSPPVVPYSNYFTSSKSSTNGFSPNGYSGGYDTGSPTYERKENVAAFHHHLPLSPVSPLHTFFHSANSGPFFAKNFAPIPKFSADMGFPSARLLSVQNGLFNNPSILTVPRDGHIISSEFKDVPVQDIPIDLSLKKPETPNSDGMGSGVNGSEEDEYINMDDNDSDSVPMRAETPLDLTSKRAVSC